MSNPAATPQVADPMVQDLADALDASAHHEPQLIDKVSSPPPASAVVVSHDADGLALHIDADAPFEAVRNALRRHFPPVSGEPVRRRRARLSLGDRPFDAFDLRRWVHQLQDEAGLTVSGVHTSPDALRRHVEQGLKVPVSFETCATVDEPAGSENADPADSAETVSTGVLADDEAPTVPERSLVELSAEPEPALGDEAEPDLSDALDLDEDAPGCGSVDENDENDENDEVDEVDELGPALRQAPVLGRGPTIPARLEGEDGGRTVVVVDRTVRGGAAFRSSGDIVVYGDVNAGAELIADGHIVVLGRLRGLAHAGAGGNEDARVIAFDLSPTQLRIAHRIAYAPERPRRVGGRSVGPWQPEVARIDGDHIVFEDYRRR